jgi:hypothetical protein
MTYEYSFSIGAAYATLKNLGDLGVPAPKASWKPFAALADLSDKMVRGLGAPVVTWEWGYLTQAQRDALRAYCTGASAAIWIRTQTMDSAGAYAYYSGVMIWPEQEDYVATRRLNFTLVFRQLTLYTPP